MQRVNLQGDGRSLQEVCKDRDDFRGDSFLSSLLVLLRGDCNNPSAAGQYASRAPTFTFEARASQAKVRKTARVLLVLTLRHHNLEDYCSHGIRRVRMVTSMIVPSVATDVRLFPHFILHRAYDISAE